MTISSPLRTGCLVLIALAMGAAPARAQDFSPFFETSGRGAVDLYHDALLCNLVLERALRIEAEGERRPLIEQGVSYTADLALFMLASGTVVEASGTILTPDRLSADRQDTESAWQEILASLADHGEAEVAETARCLRLYAHDGG